MIDQVVASSNIERVGHHRGTLFIKYQSGASYSYAGVPFPVYKEMVEAESVGQYFHRHIKGVFEYKKLEADPFDPAAPHTEQRQGDRRQAA